MEQYPQSAVYTYLKLKDPVKLFFNLHVLSSHIICEANHSHRTEKMAAIQTGLLPSDFHLFSLTGIILSIGTFLTLVGYLCSNHPIS